MAGWVTGPDEIEAALNSNPKPRGAQARKKRQKRTPGFGGYIFALGITGTAARLQWGPNDASDALAPHPVTLEPTSHRSWKSSRFGSCAQLLGLGMMVQGLGLRARSRSVNKEGPS